MIKLFQWLIGLSVYTAVWFSLITGKVRAKFLDDHMMFIYAFPVITLAVFGFGCLLLVLWRVITFNDCHVAALELQNEIKMARNDLSKKGFTFDN